MLSITPNFTMQDLQNDLDAFQEEMKQHIVDSLKVTLHQLVDAARAKTKAQHGFNNITWTLRGSIGGCILMNDQVVESYFPPLPEGEEGRQIGIGYAEDIARLQDDGEIIMVFVAGADYAKLVEAKGSDVITGTSNYMEEFFKTSILK